MKTNIYIIEGLPGVGKSYCCEVLKQQLIERNVPKRKIHFFEERDDDHPFHNADKSRYVARTRNEYEKYLRGVEAKCRNFFSGPFDADSLCIFDCALLQRPIFVSMIINNLSGKETLAHLSQLHNNYKDLSYKLIYLQSAEYINDFKAIYNDRGEDYQNHIETVWNQSAYGIAHKLHGLDGAIEVLRFFCELKLHYLHRIYANPFIIDNTEKKSDILSYQIRKILEAADS